MAIFPQSNSIKPLLGYQSGRIENVRRTPSESGVTKIRDVWGRTKFFADFEMNLSIVDSATLILFEDANRALTFTFFDFDLSLPYQNENIGTGDGSALNFTIAAKETTSQTVQVADGSGGWTTQTVVTHYNITAGSGALGEDRVIFTPGNAPASGRAVRITYTGRHRYTCEFREFEHDVVNTLGRKKFSIRVEEAF